MDKELQDAINEYERHLETGEPTFLSPQTLMDIEEYYENANRAYDAEEIMRYAERQYPDSEDVMIVKAYRLKSHGQWAEATKIIDALPDQTNREIKLFRLETEVAAGRCDKALTTLRQLMEPDDEESRNDWLLDMGELCLDYGYLDAALKLLDEIPPTYTLYHRALELTGDAYYQMKRYDKSIEAFNKLTDLNPYDSITWGQLAEIQQKAGKYEDSLTSCDYALAVDETNQRAMNLKIFATFTIGRFDDALKLYQAFVRKMPDDYAIHMYVGEQYTSARRYDLALPLLEEALKLCPVDSQDRQRIISSLIVAQAGTGNAERIRPLILTQLIMGSEGFDLLIDGADTLMGNHFVDEALPLIDYGLDYVRKTGPAFLSQAAVRTIELLSFFKFYDEAMPLWKRLAKEDGLDFRYRPAYAYLARAMFIAKDKELFDRCFLLALKECPTALVELFAQALGNVHDMESLLEYVNNAKMKWDEH